MKSKIKKHYTDNPIKLGGLNVEVQVDRSKTSHNVQAHRGRAPRHSD